MTTIRIIPKAAAALAVMVGAAVAFALPAGADVSILSDPVAAVQVGSPATLGARGAVVTVPVITVCAPGAFPTELNVEIRQNVGGDIAAGFTSMSGIACTGGFNTVNVVVLANDNAFRRGVAFARANFFVCDANGCGSGEDQREIRIVR